VVSKILAGVALALAAAVALLVGDGLGWDLDGVLFLGAGVGATLGLVPDSTPLGRLGGFMLGVLAAAVGYALRAALLPDNTPARAVALLLVIALAVGLVLLTFGRAPLWSALLGVGALGGAYEVAFTDSPGSFLSTLPVAATSLLLMVAVGFAATVFFADSGDTDEEEAQGRHRSGADPDRAEEPEQTASLDEVLSGQGGR
jgi:hypothetical protein